MRLDSPEGPDGSPSALDRAVGDLEDAVQVAAASVYVDTVPLGDGVTVRLRWGRQADTRTISDSSDRDSGRASRGVHPEQVAAYLAKYLTKTTEDFGLSSGVRSAEHARMLGATPHGVRIVDTATRLTTEAPELARLKDRLSTLGYRGHPITKSRRYSVTFGQIRRSRRLFRVRPAGLAPDADIREILDEEPPEGFEVASSFVYVGQGYLSFHEAAEAVRSAAMARCR